MTGRLAAASAATTGRGAQGRADRPIRVMLVDDSAVARAVLSRMVAAEADFDVVAQAANAEQALDFLKKMLIDIVLLDVEMPGTDGLTALPEILRRGRGARVLIVSSICEDGAAATVQALSLGAADTIPKPGSGRMNGSFSTLLIGKMRTIGRARRESEVAAPAPRDPRVDALALRPMSAESMRCLAIGASTGGLHALRTLFAALPARIGVPILVTQHLPAVFMPYFARQLAALSGRATEVATDDAPLLPDRIFVAPGDAHLCLKNTSRGLQIRLDATGASSGCLPSIDPMFASVAEEFGNRALALVLTGMGRDGSAGSARLAAVGATVLVQDPASSAVWGMPRSVAEAGHACAVLDPAVMAKRIASTMAPAINGLASWK